MARPRVRNRILEAADQLLNSEGAAALTTRAVAEQAGVTEASIFNNFGDKTGLIQALIHETLPQLRQLLECITEEPDPVDQWLEHFFQAAVAYFEMVLPLSAPFLREPVQGLNKSKSSGFYTPRLALRDRLEELKAQGRCASDLNTELVAKMLMGTAMHTATTKITLGTTDFNGNEMPTGRQLAKTLGIS